MDNTSNVDILGEITREAEKVIKIEQIKYEKSNPTPATATTSPSKSIINALQSNEDGDSWLLVNLLKNKFCYDHSLRLWFKWTGSYWEEDIIGDVISSLDSVVDKYSEEADRQNAARKTAASNQKEDDAKKAEITQKELFKRIFEIQSVKRKRNILFLAARGDNSLAIVGNEWDRDPWQLACKNGVIDLKTGSQRDGRPEDYIKTVVPTEWKGIEEKAPEWEKFLMEIFEGQVDVVQFFQRLMGYGCTGLTQDHIIPILWGHHGRNGKSTFFEAIAYVLGSIAGPIQAEMLLSDGKAKQSGAPSPDIMALRGRRIAWASETEEGRKFAVEKVKLLTGADTLVGRPLRGKRMIEFRPTHKLFLLTNHRPQIPATEYALWKRILLIEFTLSYVDEPEKSFERLRDPNLPEKLKAEASGILAWLVKGCLEWQKIGLNPPPAIKNATSKYQDDEDILGVFINECIMEDKGGKIRAQDLYNCYRRWCESLGHSPLNGTKFGENMSERYKKTTSYKGRYYEGISLIKADQIVDEKMC